MNETRDHETAFLKVGNQEADIDLPRVFDLIFAVHSDPKLGLQISKEEPQQIVAEVRNLNAYMEPAMQRKKEFEATRAVKGLKKTGSTSDFFAQIRELEESSREKNAKPGERGTRDRPPSPHHPSE